MKTSVIDNIGPGCKVDQGQCECDVVYWLAQLAATLKNPGSSPTQA
jgi:hypothetical protein